MAVQVRETRQKQAIRDAFADADRPLSPAEALALAEKHAPKLSIATVYRNVATLVEEGWLTAVELPGESTRYELAGKKHHHHFQCKTCDKVFEFKGCKVKTAPKLPRGFRVTGHEFFFYGTCAECR